MEIRANNPADIPIAYSRYYALLADVFSRMIKPGRPQIILEVGCGKGQLTLPLLDRLPRKTRLIGVDSSRGPYTRWLDELELRVDQRRLADRVHLVKADARNMRSISRASIDTLVSNELVCDLPREHQLEKALKEFRRVLRPGGKMIHGEWSSSPYLKDQPFMAEHWPTWNPDQLFNQLQRLDYRGVKVTYFDTTIWFRDKAAIEEVRTWGASPKLIKSHDRALKRSGIRLPFDHLIECKK